jgi:hypothetical protein
MNGCAGHNVKISFEKQEPFVYGALGGSTISLVSLTTESMGEADAHAHAGSAEADTATFCDRPASETLNICKHRGPVLWLPTN